LIAPTPTVFLTRGSQILGTKEGATASREADALSPMQLGGFNISFGWNFHGRVTPIDTPAKDSKFSNNKFVFVNNSAIGKEFEAWLRATGAWKDIVKGGNQTERPDSGLPTAQLANTSAFASCFFAGLQLGLLVPGLAEMFGPQSNWTQRGITIANQAMMLGAMAALKFASPGLPTPDNLSKNSSGQEVFATPEAAGGISDTKGMAAGMMLPSLALTQGLAASRAFMFYLLQKFQATPKTGKAIQVSSDLLLMAAGIGLTFGSRWAVGYEPPPTPPGEGRGPIPDSMLGYVHPAFVDGRPRLWRDRLSLDPNQNAYNKLNSFATATMIGSTLLGAGIGGLLGQMPNLAPRTSVGEKVGLLESLRVTGSGGADSNGGMFVKLGLLGTFR